MADVLTKEQRHKNMQHIRSRNTKIELIMRKALWKRGIRYRKNYVILPGKPDIAITKYKIAVFCDSEFFHGKDWDELKPRIMRGDNGKFWVNKISENIKRDYKEDQELRTLGWHVIRFWGTDIKKHTSDCVQTIEDMIFEIRIHG